MRRVLAAMACALLAGLGLASAAAAELEITDPWVAEPPPGAMATGAFMVVRNPGDADVRIVGASSAACRRTELHRTRIEGGMARMKSQPEIVVPARESLAFERGSYHLMLIGPEALRSGDRVEIAIETADGEKQSFQAEVRKR